MWLLKALHSRSRLAIRSIICFKESDTFIGFSDIAEPAICTFEVWCGCVSSLATVVFRRFFPDLYMHTSCAELHWKHVASPEHLTFRFWQVTQAFDRYLPRLFAGACSFGDCPSAEYARCGLMGRFVLVVDVVSSFNPSGRK
jgi:hypothetical protein